MTSRSAIAVDQPEVDTHSVAAVERPSRRATPRKGSGLLKFFIFVLILAGVGGAIYASMGKEKVIEGLK